jgi:hypothetical protein
LGLPLLHYTRGICPETGRRIIAKGVLAVGRLAMGVLAIGHASFGAIAIGQLGLGILLGLGQGATGLYAVGQVALLRRKPRLRAEAHFGAQARVFRPWMNARRAPFDAPKERSRVCFGGFRPTKHVEEPRLRGVTHFGVQARALARGASLWVCCSV